MKKNVSPEIILEDPKGKVEELEPRPEKPRTSDDANAVAAHEARDTMMRDRMAAENEERRQRGPKVGHNVYYNEVQKGLVSRLFLALEDEEKNNLYRKILTKKFRNWKLKYG